MNFKKILAMIMVIVVAGSCIVFAPSVKSEGQTFEQSIAGFPASYKPYLRALHKTYPNWKFVPYNTNVTFASAVAKEASGDRSLIENSFSKFFKSNASGDYNSKTKRYIAKDGGVWVSSSKNAIAYFMDPRNFLNSTYIYMFESLTYDGSTQTQAGVETILKGSFMYNTNICYINTKGKYVKTNTKYSAQIMAAAKASNVSAYYIASKILQEIGASKGSKPGMGASGSVSGTYGGYTGIYNFYNIGAFSGANPVASGLKWAKSGSSYSRPWNTPAKSINGGAKYIGSTYINCGQYTTYFQRFNVNRGSSYGMYNHQYMTNVYGAAAETGFTSSAYKANGSTKLTKKFVIPVYKNMTATNHKINLGASKKYGKTTKKMCLRSGPGLAYKSKVTLPKGTVLTIHSGTISNRGYGTRLLSNPYWLYVTAKKGKKTYNGYFSANRVSPYSEKYVTKGVKTKLPFSSKNYGKIYFRSNNPAICTVNSKGIVTPKKKGSVTIYAFSAFGSMSLMKITVVTSGVKVSPSKVSLYAGQTKKLKVKLYPSKKKNSVSKYKSSNTSVASVSKKGKITTKKPGMAVIYCIPKSGFTGSCVVNVMNPTPAQPRVTAKRHGYNSVKISWNNQANIRGYHIYRKTGNGKIHYIKTVNGRCTTIIDYNLLAGTKYTYSVVAYRKVGKKVYNGKGSVGQSATPYPSRPTKFKITKTKKGPKLTWKAVKGASGYVIVRKRAKDKYKSIGSTKTALKYTDKKVKKNIKYTYKVIAYTKVSNKLIYGSYSKKKSYTKK